MFRRTFTTIELWPSSSQASGLGQPATLKPTISRCCDAGSNKEGTAAQVSKTGDEPHRVAKLHWTHLDKPSLNLP
jgi:hypothetical protein